MTLAEARKVFKRHRGAQSALAKRLNFSGPYIVDVAYGRRRNPQILTAWLALAEELKAKEKEAASKPDVAVERACA